MTYEEIVTPLINGGEISFEMPASKRRTMKKCMDRMNKVQRSFNKTTWYLKPYYFIYSMYCGLLQILATNSCRELDNAVTAYQVAWKHIKTIKGQDIPNGRIKVTFVGHT